MSSEQFDLCVFDWKVPDVSGFEVLASLRLKGNVLPVIFLTGRDAEEDIIKVMDAGTDDYIVKRLNLNVLVAQINAHLRRNQGNLHQEQVVNYGELSVDLAKENLCFLVKAWNWPNKETELTLLSFRPNMP